jgi:hypothetical protein
MSTPQTPWSAAACTGRASDNRRSARRAKRDGITRAWRRFGGCARAADVEVVGQPALRRNRRHDAGRQGGRCGRSAPAASRSPTRSRRRGLSPRTAAATCARPWSGTALLLLPPQASAACAAAPRQVCGGGAAARSACSAAQPAAAQGATASESDDSPTGSCPARELRRARSSLARSGGPAAPDVGAN